MGHCRWDSPAQFQDAVPCRSHGLFPEIQPVGHHGYQAPERAVTIINPQTGTFFPWIFQDVACFAFSRTTEELVYGMVTMAVQHFDEAFEGHRISRQNNILRLSAEWD
jgi:hypothetical protein